MTDMKEVVEWLDDDGWKPYPASLQAQILRAKVDGVDPLTIHISRRKTYEIYINKKYQRNPVTNFIRYIRFTGGILPVVLQDLQAFNDFKRVDFKRLDKDELCSLCLCEFEQKDQIIQLANCHGHYFHETCDKNMSILKYVTTNNQCLVCKQVYGTITGNMPLGGAMQVETLKESLPGFEDVGTLYIIFQFARGIQDQSHPHPGVPFSSDWREAYLPDNAEGQRILDLFRKAWDRRLLFTIGYSLTRHVDNNIIYNRIHMKTKRSGTHGYPDPTYFARVTEELKQKGVT